MAKSDNKARQQRILTIAAELFIHYGYDKTAVSDIARQAGVSQGTIYLHFNSKEELLEQLIIREMKSFGEAWLARVEEDPNGGTIGGMYKSTLYVLDSNPFMAAMFRKDGRILGSYMQKDNNFFRQQDPSMRQEFITLMQEAGTVRKDIDPKVAAHIMNILSYGLVGMDGIIDRKHMPPTEDLINGIADFMERALAPEGGGNSEIGKAILRKLANDALQQYEQAQEELEEDNHDKR